MKNDKENTLYGNSVPMENNSRLDYKKKNSISMIKFFRKFIPGLYTEFSKE